MAKEKENEKQEPKKERRTLTGDRQLKAIALCLQALDPLTPDEQEGALELIRRRIRAAVCKEAAVDRPRLHGSNADFDRPGTAPWEKDEGHGESH